MVGQGVVLFGMGEEDGGDAISGKKTGRDIMIINTGRYSSLGEYGFYV